MKLFRFLLSKTFWFNIFIILLIAAAFLYGISSFLDYYTRHGQTVKVPDLSEMAVPEAAGELAENGLEYSILDSAEFDPSYPRGSVINQYPEPGTRVKRDREIRLTLNPQKPRKINLPNVIDKTKRRALYDLESKGFEIGELEYVPYIGEDVVVDVKIDGESAKTGVGYPKGTEVILVLGRGLGREEIRVPYLRWLSADEAREKLHDKSLNTGAVIYDPEVEDSTSALVYRQNPEPSKRPAIKPGMAVDIWLTEDHTKIPADSLEYQNLEQDTLYDDTFQDSIP